MANHDATMVALTDSSAARLVALSLTERNNCRVEEVDALTQPDEHYEHSRPSPRKGLTGDPGDDHESEEERLRFARRVVAWLKRHPRGNGRLVVFAPPRFRGALRRCGWRAETGRTELRDGDLINVPIAALADHPAIRAVVERA